MRQFFCVRDECGELPEEGEVKNKIFLKFIKRNILVYQRWELAPVGKYNKLWNDSDRLLN